MSILDLRSGATVRTREKTNAQQPRINELPKIHSFLTYLLLSSKGWFFYNKSRDIQTLRFKKRSDNSDKYQTPEIIFTFFLFVPRYDTE